MPGILRLILSVVYFTIRRREEEEEEEDYVGHLKLVHCIDKSIYYALFLLFVWINLFHLAISHCGG